MATNPELLLDFAVEVAIFALAATVMRRFYTHLSFLPHRVNLLPFNRGVILNGDTVEKVVEPGHRWIAPGRTLVPVDIRPKPFQVPAREVITADQGGVRLTFGGEYKISDPSAYVRESSDPFGTLFLALERVIPSAGSEFDMQTLLAAPSLLADRVQELSEPRAAQLGITIVALEVSSVVALGWIVRTSER